MKLKEFFNKLKVKLKKIDFNELFEKANNINIEDIKNISSDDIKKFVFSKKMIPYFGCISFLILTNSLLMPAVNQLNILIKRADLYKNESKELPSLKSRLKSLDLRKSMALKSIEPIRNSIIKSQDLIFLTELLNKSTSKARVQIISFEPIEIEQTKSCEALSSKEISTLGLSSSMKNPSQEFFGPNSFENSNILQKNNKSKNVSNYFKLNIKGDYLKTIAFIDYLQEYDVTIVPTCFRSENISESINASNSQKAKGIVNSELIFNVPTNTKRTF